MARRTLDPTVIPSPLDVAVSFAPPSEMLDSRMRVEPTAIADHDPVGQALASIERELDDRFGEVMALNRLRQGERPAWGKLLRPRLLVTTAAAMERGRLPRRTIVIAAAVELVHLATLHHDDVLDASPDRRRAASAPRSLGNKTSILLGDSLLTAALELLSRHATRAMLIVVSRAVSNTLRGEIEQHMRMCSLDLHPRSCLAVNARKTGSLFGLAAQLGAMLAGADHARVVAARRYGVRLGTAFQLIDDALDYVGSPESIGKRPGTDYREGVATFPLIRALAGASVSDREMLEAGFGASPEPREFDEVRAAVIRAGGIDATLVEVERRLAEAHRCLDRFAPPDTTRLFSDYVHVLSSRNPGRRLESMLSA